jgi:hypothetical protein
MEKASELIDKLITAGAEELDGARENIIDVIGLLDDLEFEEGNLISTGEPLAAVSAAGEEDDEDEEVEEFREDSEEE